MPVAAYNKFDQFVEDLANKLHDLGTDQLTVALTNVAPNAANSVIADISEIAYTNLSARDLTTTSANQISGTLRLIVEDLVLTAGGAVATFRYVVIYNSTVPAGPLICWADYGSPVTMANGETFTLNLDQSNGLLSIT